MPNHAGGTPAGSGDDTSIDPAGSRDGVPADPIGSPDGIDADPTGARRLDGPGASAVHGGRTVRQRVTDDGGSLMSARWRRVRSGRRRVHPDGEPPATAPPAPPDPTTPGG